MAEEDRSEDERLMYNGSPNPPPPAEDMDAAVKTSARAQIAVCQNRVALCPARTPSGSRNLFTAGGVKSGSAHGARAPSGE